MICMQDLHTYYRPHKHNDNVTDFNTISKKSITEESSLQIALTDIMIKHIFTFSRYKTVKLRKYFFSAKVDAAILITHLFFRSTEPPFGLLG